MGNWDAYDATARSVFVSLRSEAEQVMCPEPGCAAPAGATCQNLTSGEPLGHVPAHLKRIQKARG